MIFEALAHISLKKKLTPLFVLSLLSQLALAQNSNLKTPQWHEQIVGILAIPAAIIGLVYSAVLIRKTRLESEKAKLEIEKIRATLDANEVTSNINSTLLIEPILQNKEIQLVILRFVLLYVTLELWSLVDSVYGLATYGVFVSISKSKENLLDTAVSQYIIITVQQLPNIVKWTLTIGVGLPLFRDVSKILGMDRKRLFLPWLDDKNENK